MWFKFPFSLSRDVYCCEAENEFYCHSIDAVKFTSTFYCLWINFQLLVQFMTFVIFLPQNPSASTCGRNDLMFHAASRKRVAYLLCCCHCLMLVGISFGFLFLLVGCSQYRKKDFNCLVFNAVRKGTWKLTLMKFCVVMEAQRHFSDSLLSRAIMFYSCLSHLHDMSTILNVKNITFEASADKNLIKLKRDAW